MSKKDNQHENSKSEKEFHENDPALETLTDQLAQEEETSEQANPEVSETEELKKQLAEQKDKFIRLYAEFENYKKRTIKEKLDFMKNASQDILSALLPVLDDFDRAKKNAEIEGSKETFSEGIHLVYNKLYNILQSRGLKPMESTGQPFDPEFHEAFSELPVPDEKMKGKVIDTVETGYFLNDKIIRHAKVVVGK